MSEFHYQNMLPLEEEETPYRCLTKDFVSEAKFEGQSVLKVESEGLIQLARQAFVDISHFYRPEHLQQLRRILDDSEASDNDRFVALELLKNANIAASQVLPSCQDTGTAIVMGKKGERVFTSGHDEASLSEGIAKTFTETNLRYSQMAPIDFYKEVNTGNNLPAQIEMNLLVEQ